MPFCLRLLSPWPAHLSLRRVCGSLGLAVFALVFVASPAHAGHWQFTITGNGTGSVVPHSGFASSQQGVAPQPWSAPNSSNDSISTQYEANATDGPDVNVAYYPDLANIHSHAEANVTFHVAVAWVPTGSLANDPEPAVLRIAETATSQWKANGTQWIGSGGNKIGHLVTGTGSATLTGATSGTTQYTMPGGFTGRDVTFIGNADISIPPPHVFGYNCGADTSFRYSISSVPLTGTLRVDPDQQVITPAATTRFTATISGATPSLALDSINISVDGTSTAATIVPSTPSTTVGSWSGYIDWTQVGGNPSEHSITATAQLHDSVGAITLNSLDLASWPPSAYRSSGMGQVADDIVADVRIRSIKFNNNIALNQDAVTAVPTPEFTWVGINSAPATSNPVAYTQGQNVNFTMLLGSSTGIALTGNATLGYTTKVTATPNTVNPSTKKADPVLTLYDNTNSPVTPASYNASTPVAATTPLSAWVATYKISFSSLSLFAEFTKVPSPRWVGISYDTGIGNTLYATVATPTDPMATPWVPVLDKACDWAKRTTDATSATTALATGLYNNFTYNGFTTHTILPISFPPGGGRTPPSPTYGTQNFSLSAFLSDRQGDCQDFSDCMVCLSNAIGAKNLQAQRSDTDANINMGQVEFRTKNFIAAPYQQQAVPSPNSWVFHQWSVADNVFDADIGTTPTPLVNLPLSTYFSTLVDQTLPYRWNPQAAFVPIITN